MSSAISIPAAGLLVAAELDLSGQDLRIAIDRLKAAADELIQSRSAESSAHFSPPPQQQPEPEPSLPPVASAFAALSLDRQATASTTFSAVPTTPPAQPSFQWEAPSAAMHAPPAMPQWQLCWTTDALDHDRNAVTSIAYATSLPGLPGGDGHGGWVVTSSRGLLQLWECSRSLGRGEPALMIMHAQNTDHVDACSAVEMETRLLLVAGAEEGSGAEGVFFHSLDADTLLAQRGKVPMPHRPESRLAGRHCLAVVSLHSFGGPLALHCASSYGGGIAVWEAGTAQRPAAPQGPRALWKAHDSLITALHAGKYGLDLYSGAADGSVHQWNMRAKPSKATAVFKHTGAVAGIYQVNDTVLVTAAADGNVLLWDLRNTAQPQDAAAPDGSPITHLAVSPFGDAAAVATVRGVYCIDLIDPGAAVSPVSSGAMPCPTAALTWNAATGGLMCGGTDGSVRVFVQS